MEQIQFIYFQDYNYAILYCPSQRKQHVGIWKFGIVDDNSSSAHNCQFVLVLL